MSWQGKAHRIIAALCRVEYERANRLPNGKLRNRHRSYSVPDTAQTLVEALGRNDEETAKAIFLFDYDVRGK